MFRFGAFALLIVVAESPIAAGIQRAPAIERIEVALWPEYDRPDEVLVIYRFRLTPGTPMPATVAIAVPADVEEPHAVAWQDSRGGLMNADFRRVVDDDRALILVTMQGLEGQLEFYRDLTREGARRRFRFRWPGGIEAQSFSFEIQHPSGASSFQTVPPADARAVGQDGLTYEGTTPLPLAASATPAIELSYEKESPTLSADTLRPPPTSAPASPPPAEPPWLLYTFGGGLIGLGLFLLWWTSRKPAQQPAILKTDPKFCFNCGEKLEPRGAYCISCGARVRQ